MALQVNLLKKSRVLTEKQYQLERKIFLASLISFVVVICIEVAVFFAQVVITSRIKIEDEAIAKVSAQLAGLQTANIQQIYLKSRLKLVSDIFNGRQITREALQRVLDLAIPGVTISSIMFEEKDILKISVDARSVASFDQVYKFFENNKDFFTIIVNEGVNRAADGSYVTTLILHTPQEKVAQ